MRRYTLILLWGIRPLTVAVYFFASEEAEPDVESAGVAIAARPFAALEVDFGHSFAECPASPQNKHSPCLRRHWRSSGRSLPSLPSLDEMESGVEEELPLLLLLLLLLLLPLLLEELEVDVEEEEPLDFLSLGLLDEDEELLVLEPDDLEEEFWFPEFELEALEARESSSLRSQYLWSIFWDRVRRSTILSGLP